MALALADNSDRNNRQDPELDHGRKRRVSMGGTVAAVSFDGDGTLWDVRAAARAALASTAAVMSTLLPVGASPVTVQLLEADPAGAAGRREVRRARRCAGGQGGAGP